MDLRVLPPLGAWSPASQPVFSLDCWTGSFQTGVDDVVDVLVASTLSAAVCPPNQLLGPCSCTTAAAASDLVVVFDRYYLGPLQQRQELPLVLLCLWRLPEAADWLVGCFCSLFSFLLLVS